jgi:hypothetical protein
MNTFIVVAIERDEAVNNNDGLSTVSGLHFYLGSRAFFLLFFAGECRERHGIQPDDRL